MSRGPGDVQRRLLRALAKAPGSTGPELCRMVFGPDAAMSNVKLSTMRRALGSLYRSRRIAPVANDRRPKHWLRIGRTRRKAKPTPVDTAVQLELPFVGGSLNKPRGGVLW